MALSAGASSQNGAPYRAAKEVLWLSATAVRPFSTATSITTPGCSGDGRAAEHGAFSVEGRALASYHAIGRVA